MDSVCFRVVETENGNLIFYFHGPYFTGGKSYIVVSPLLKYNSPELKKFLEDWFNREVINLSGLDFKALQSLVKDNAKVEFPEEGIGIINKISPTNSERKQPLHLNPRIVIPKVLRPEVLDPKIDERKKANAETHLKFFGEKIDASTK